jgi:TonB family protein
MSPRRRTRWRTPPFFGLSVATHIVILAVVAGTSLGRACQPEASVLGGAGVARNEGPIDVTMIEPSVLNEYAARPDPVAEAAELEKKVEEARHPEEQRDLAGQVVDTARPNVEIRPDHARFLSEFDSKVEHETKAPPASEPGAARPQRVASVTQRPQPATPRVEEIPTRAPRPAQHGQRGAGADGALAMRSANPLAPAEKEHGQEDGLPRAPDGTDPARGAAAQAVEPGGAPGEEQAGEAGQMGQTGSPGSPEVPPGPRPSDLRPSEEMLARAVGAGSNDYLKDVDEGNETLLNTKRWKYWSFFSRVKKGVAHEWRPDHAYRLRDPTGQIYGQKNRFTVLKVSLKADGSLDGLLIEKPCGVDFLDDEAVTAFNRAQPFPNPPDGLVDPGSHLITFRFGFYFEISGAPTFKVFRQ